MKKLRRLYFKIFRRYEILERKFCMYSEADKLISDTHNKPEEEQWVLDVEREDDNHQIGWVYLCRQKRITE